jgi:predicted transposase YbfD/YdcC
MPTTNITLPSTDSSAQIGHSGLKSLLQHLTRVPEKRMLGRIKHPLPELLLVAFIATVCGGECFTDMEIFAKAELDWLRNYVPLKNGAPSHDTFRYAFSLIKPKSFAQLLEAWALSGTVAPDGRRIMIDGKALRGSDSPAAGKDMLHILRAWVADSGMSISHELCTDKANEIEALPRLLANLDLEDTLISIDAMGTHPATTEQIIKGGGHYILCLKKNQPEAYAEVEARYAQFDAFRQKHAQAPSMVYDWKEARLDHGHYVHWTCEATPVSTEVGDWFKKDWKWWGLQSVVRVTRHSHRGGKQSEPLSQETHYYLTSLPPDPERLATEIRRHWLVENASHYVLDVTFMEDQNQTRDRNAAVNLSFFREIAAKAIRDYEPKKSIRSKRKLAGWGNAYRGALLNHAFHNFHA